MGNQNETMVLDIDQLRDVCMEDDELMRELVTSLIDDARKQVAGIEDAVEHADGTVSMAAILKSIERSAGMGDFGACRTSLANLAAELQKLSTQAATL